MICGSLLLNFVDGIRLESMKIPKKSDFIEPEKLIKMGSTDYIAAYSFSIKCRLKKET